MIALMIILSAVMLLVPMRLIYLQGRTDGATEERRRLTGQSVPKMKNVPPPPPPRDKEAAKQIHGEFSNV